MSTAKKFAGQTAIYGLSTVASRVLNFFLTAIYTRTFAPSVYGVLNTLYAYASMLNAVLSFGMETTFFRYLNKHEDKKDVVYNNSFFAILSVGVVFFAGTFVFTDSIAVWILGKTPGSHDDFVLFIKFFICILIIDSYSVIPFAKVRADGRPGRYGAIKAVNIMVFIAFNLIFIKVIPFVISHNIVGYSWLSSWYKPGWLGYVFVSNLIASMLTFVLLLPEVVKLKLRFDFGMFKLMVLYSWPILIANISYIINENVDKMMLPKLLPATLLKQGDVGIYAAGCKIALFLSIFINAFRLGAEPFFFNQAKNKNAKETYARIMNYFVIAVVMIFVAIIANIEILKFFIHGKDAVETKLYWSGLRVVPLLLFGYVSLGIYMNLSVWYKLSDQTKYGFYISGIGAILTIALNWIFIPKYSYIASAWVSLIAYATMMILSYLWGQKNYPIPYNIKKNLIYITVSIVIVILSFYVFDRNIFVGNALLIMFALSAYFVERKELMLILKK